MSKLLKIYNSILTESYENGQIFGYHATSRSNLESIKQTGLKIGHRAMQGKGLYAFYDYEHAIRYVRKGEINDPILIKFVVRNPKIYLYLNMDVAKQVLGSDYHLINQLDKYFSVGGLDRWYEMAKQVYKRDLTKEEYINIINDIETNNSEMKQRTFMFHLIPSNELDNLNVVWNGNYGIEFKINALWSIKEIGFIEINDNSFHEFDDSDMIPDTEEYAELKNIFKSQNISLPNLYNKLYKHRDTVRNNREYDYYSKLIDQIDNILHK